MTLCEKFVHDSHSLEATGIHQQTYLNENNLLS